MRLLALRALGVVASDLTTLAGQEKLLVAHPSGAIALAPANPPLPDGSWAWTVPGLPTTAGAFPPADARDDVAFLRTVIRTVDGSAASTTTTSTPPASPGGGRMASALACEPSDVVAAGDFVNPLPGNGDLRWGYAVSLAVQTWARLNRCQVGPAVTTVSEHVTRFTSSRCADRADVVYHRVTDGGHTWPGTSVDLSPLGPTTQEIDATALMWQFFEDRPKR